MKRRKNFKFKLIVFIFSVIIVSCQNDGKTEKINSSISKTDSCTDYIEHHYEVYIPQRTNSKKTLTLLVVLDSKGAGKYAIQKFKQTADKYGTIVVASDLIKNNFENYINATDALIKDVTKKYPVGKTIYMCGFSGGARMTLNYALIHNHISGIILCGAFASQHQLSVLSCPVVSISGINDFNFSESANYFFKMEEAPYCLKFELTADAHQWPNESILKRAVGYLVMDEKNPAINRHEKKIFYSSQEKRIDSLQKTGEFIKSALVLHNIMNSDLNKFRKKFTELTETNGYLKQISLLGENLKLEEKSRQPYYNALQEKDTIWWKNEISNLNHRIDTTKNIWTKSMYCRMKGFLGIACYSISKQSAQNKQIKQLKHILPIYSLLEPKNPDVFYFSAIFDMLQGKNEDVIKNLKKAKELGYSDLKQMQKDFPDKIINLL